MFFKVIYQNRYKSQLRTRVGLDVIHDKQPTLSSETAEFLDISQKSVPMLLCSQRESRALFVDDFDFNHEAEFRPLMSLFEDYGNSICQDRRDKVYGLLSIASDCCKNAITVDYSSTWQKVYYNVLLHHSAVHRLHRTEPGSWEGPDREMTNTRQFHLRFGIYSKYFRSSCYPLLWNHL